MRHNPYVVDTRPAFATDMEVGNSDTENDEPPEGDPQPPPAPIPLSEQYNNFCNEYKNKVQKIWNLWKNVSIDQIIQQAVNEYLEHCVKVDSTYNTIEYWSTGFDADLIVRRQDFGLLAALARAPRS
jgi:hypothetical protein